MRRGPSDTRVRFVREINVPLKTWDMIRLATALSHAAGPADAGITQIGVYG